MKKLNKKQKEFLKLFIMYLEYFHNTNDFNSPSLYGELEFDLMQLTEENYIIEELLRSFENVRDIIRNIEK